MYDIGTLSLWIGVGVALIVGGIQVAGWRHRGLIIGLIVLGAICVIAAIAVPPLATKWPSIAAFMANAATPSTWVILLLFVAAIVLLGPLAKNTKSPEVENNGGPIPLTLPEMQGLLQVQENKVRGEVSGAYNHINQVRDDVAGIREKLADIDRQIAVDWPNSRTVAEAFSNLGDATRIQIRRIEETVEKCGEQIRAANLDLNHLLFFATDIATLETLNALIIEGDPLRVPLGDNVSEVDRSMAVETVGEYIRRAVSKFADTHRGAMISNVIYNAEQEAERELRAIPADERPAHIDLLDYRKLKIIETKRVRLLAFLYHQRDEKKGEIAQQRSRLLERMDARKPR